MNSKLTKIGIFKPSKWFALAMLLLFVSGISCGQVAINNDNSAPDASAMLDVKATGLGLLVPRMTAAQIPGTPATGLMVYITDVDPGYYYYDGAAWQKIGRDADHLWTDNAGTAYRTSSTAVGLSESEGYGINSVWYSSAKSAVRGVEGFGTTTVYSEGQLGVLNYTGNPLALPIGVPNIGVFGYKPNTGLNGTAIYGYSVDTDAENYSGIFATMGVSTNTNYGIYSMADSAGTNYAGYFKGRVHVMGHNGDAGAADSTSTVLYSEVTHTQYNDTRAVYGISTPQDGYGYGVYGQGGYRGVYGYGDGGTYTGTVAGVYGYAGGSAGTRVGVYGYASGGTTNWAGYFSGSVYSTDLRVGTTTQASGYIVSVNGKIACEEVLVEDSGSWPDYVFDADYDLMSLEEVENHINENSHLPGLPSAAEVQENGFEIADMQKRVLEKVEELTLHTIEQGKLIKQLQEEVNNLKAENTSLKNQ